LKLRFDQDAARVAATGEVDLSGSKKSIFAKIFNL